LKFDARRRAEERAKHEKEDMELLNRISAELEIKERERVESKQKEKQVIRQLMSENDRERHRKMELKKLAMESDLIQINEYNTMLEKEERKREEEMNHRIERQKLLMKKMEENVMKTIQSKADDDNQRALKQQAERDVKQMEIEKFKRDKLAKLREEMISTLHQQIREKNDRNKEEDELKDLHAQILKADTSEFEESEKKRRELRKKIYCKYREQLRDQIQNVRSVRAAEDGSMNDDEIKMNRDLIEVVEKVLREESIVGSNSNAC
jgi:hypothetical protein